MNYFSPNSHSASGPTDYRSANGIMAGGSQGRSSLIHKADGKYSSGGRNAYGSQPTSAAKSGAAPQRSGSSKQELTPDLAALLAQLLTTPAR